MISDATLAERGAQLVRANGIDIAYVEAGPRVPTFHARAPDQAHAASAPDTTWPIRRAECGNPLALFLDGDEEDPMARWIACGGGHQSISPTSARYEAPDRHYVAEPVGLRSADFVI